MAETLTSRKPPSASTGTLKPRSSSKRTKPGIGGLRNATHESWDDDFLFQHSSSSSLALPISGGSSRAPTPSSEGGRRTTSLSSVHSPLSLLHSYSSSPSSPSTSTFTPPTSASLNLPQPQVKAKWIPPQRSSKSSTDWSENEDSEEEDETVRWDQETPKATVKGRGGGLPSNSSFSNNPQQNAATTTTYRSTSSTPSLSHGSGTEEDSVSTTTSTRSGEGGKGRRRWLRDMFSTTSSSSTYDESGGKEGWKGGKREGGGGKGEGEEGGRRTGERKIEPNTKGFVVLGRRMRSSTSISNGGLPLPPSSSDIETGVKGGRGGKMSVSSTETNLSDRTRSPSPPPVSFESDDGVGRKRFLGRKRKLKPISGGGGEKRPFELNSDHENNGMGRMEDGWIAIDKPPTLSPRAVSGSSTTSTNSNLPMRLLRKASGSKPLVPVMGSRLPVRSRGGTPPSPTKPTSGSSSTKTPPPLPHPPTTTLTSPTTTNSTTTPTSTTTKNGKRPLSLSNLISKSTSSLHLSTPTSPTFPKNLRPPTPSSPSKPPTSTTTRKVLHKTSSSLSNTGENPPSRPSSRNSISFGTGEGGFFARARAFSRGGKEKEKEEVVELTVGERRKSLRKAPPQVSGSSAVGVGVGVAGGVGAAVSKPRLGEGWKMPLGGGGGERPLSSSSEATIRPRPPSTSRRAKPPVTRRPGIVITGSSTAAVERGLGHRPSMSLGDGKSKFNFFPSGNVRGGEEERGERPKTAMGSRDWGDEMDNDDLGGVELQRRNSLSDLRIPSRITSSQARIEEDLERVREFAKGIERLKALRSQYQQLIKIVISPPSSPEPAGDLLSSSPIASPPPEVMAKMAQAIKRLEIDYRSWWEQAEALVDLGDGKQRKDSPGVIASKRDRCVSLAPTSPSRRADSNNSDTETEITVLSTSSGGGTVSGTGPRRRPHYGRRPSASSIETGAASLEDRQREMLRGVLSPSIKGASLPSRGQIPSRPSLGALDPNARSITDPNPVPPVTPSKPIPLDSPGAPPARQGGIRRVSRAGVSGIKDFLLRLKMKATEDAGEGGRGLEVGGEDASPGRRLVSDPARGLSPDPGLLKARMMMRTPTAAVGRRCGSSDEEEDWDRQSMPDVSPRNTVVVPSTPGTLRRNRTQSSKVGASMERMVLTTEAMPSLLLKVREVNERCLECIVRLRGLTV